MEYDELGYSLPQISAEDAATRAIKILEKVAVHDSASLFYLVQASNILALAGLRAQSPYNEFEPGFSEEKRKTLAELLQKNGYEILRENDPYSDRPPHDFSILCVDAFNDIPKRYASVKPFWKNPTSLTSYSDFVLWDTYMINSVVETMRVGRLPEKWSSTWWNPHHICFGMRLGYPGQAISSICWDEDIVEKGKHISMPFQGTYSGTHITYDYSPDITDTSILKAHEALWTDTLGKVYAVFSEARLADYQEFMAEFARYKAYSEQ